MADRILAELEDAAVRTILDGLGASAQPYVDAASKETAEAIVREAKARLHRQLTPDATGLLEAGITYKPADKGTGYVVVSDREHVALSLHTMKRSGRTHVQAVTQTNVPRWMEKGTRKGDSTHANYARPYFWISAELEAGAHYRRIGEALQQAIDEKGLGS